MKTIEQILVPIDFSAPFLKAFDDAVEFSRRYSAELILMFMVERRYYESLILVTDSGAILQHQAEVAQAKFEEICTSVRARGVNCRAIVEGGVAYKAIVDTAKKNQRESHCDVNSRTHQLASCSNWQRRRESRAT